MTTEFTPKSWEVARLFADEFGGMPAAFQTCIRSLRQNHIQNKEHGGHSVDTPSLNLLLRLLQSKTLTACFYYALMTFYGEQVKDQDYLPLDKMIGPFGPGALASILALIYLNKYSKKLTKEGWEALSRRIQESSEIGGLLGQSTPSLGFDSSLFVGPMRHIAFAAVLQDNPRLYIEYKKFLKKVAVPYNIEWELEHFGCTLGQIGSMLLQLCGFGIPYANAFFQATSAKFDTPISRDATDFRMVAVWSESILLGCPIPRVEGEDEYAMEEYQMRNLLSRAEEIRENGSKYSFLNRTKEDVSPHKTPQLFTPEERAAAPAPEGGKDEIDELLT